MTLIQRRLTGLGVFVLVGGLGALLVLWQVRRSDSQSQEKNAAQKILRLDKVDSVRSIVLVTPTARFVLVRQAPTGETAWKLTSPIETLAEKSGVDGLLGQLSELRRSREVGEAQDDGRVIPPADLKLFELAPPRFTVAITTDDGVTEELHVGKKSSFDGSVFVTVEGKAEVSVVPGALEYQVDKDLFKLREKRLVIFEANDATRLVVTHVDAAAKKPQSYVVKRSGEDWLFEAPRLMPADPTQLSGILSALAGARAKSFVSERATAQELKRFRLDLPTAKVEVTTKEEAPLVLLFSEVKTGDSTTYYATRGVDQPILELSSEWPFKKAVSNVDDLRDKRVLKMDRDAVRKLTLTKGETKLSFERRRDTDKDRDTWTMTEPFVRPVSDATLTGLIYNLGNLRGEHVLSWEATDSEWAEAGLDKPELQIAVGRDGDERMTTLLVAGIRDGGRIAASTQSRRIDLVDAARIADISFNPDDYKDLSAKSEP
jgi:hypothetical protein